MAILVRAGFQTREFEERLITTGVPYRVIGGPRFYERQEIRDAMAYLRVIVSPDNDLSFERIVNKPKRGLGAATLQKVHALARAGQWSLYEAARRIVETDELGAKARRSLREVVEDFARWRDMSTVEKHTDLAAIVLDESGYVQMWKQDKAPDAQGRVENLKEFVAALSEFESLEGFLEHVALVMENDEKDDREKVSLMTLHAAKGLEFDRVFLPGWEEGLFPHERALNEGGGRALEEERRLAYVGLTRARKWALLSFSANRRIYNQWQAAIPSRFVDELPPGAVEVDSAQGLYEGGRGHAGGGWNTAPSSPSSSPRRSAPPPVIDADAWEWEGPKDNGAYEIGTRVFHDKFGYGAVTEADGDKLAIRFEKTGAIKKVMASFVSPA